jgi:hypothetical protein
MTATRTPTSGAPGGSGEVVLAVYQAALDVMYGLSIQLDVRRSPVDAPLEPSSPFVDWMWIDP